MAVSVKSSVQFSRSSANKSIDFTHQLSISSTSNSIQFAKSQSLGQFLTAPEPNWRPNSTNNVSVNASYWWEKTKKPNMMEIRSAQDLVHTLKNSGDHLVVIDFYSPGCGGCRALHPKICELAESNPDAIFLKINYEELKKMCYALEIHVLPFFRFYRGSKGRLCSFSCTLSTIGKFKDALAKYNNKREVQSGVGDRAKGLDESEVLRLMSIGEISGSEEVGNLFMEVIKNPNPRSITKELLGAMGDHALLLGDRA